MGGAEKMEVDSGDEEVGDVAGDDDEFRVGWGGGIEGEEVGVELLD